jgi:hypothetical protein
MIELEVCLNFDCCYCNHPVSVTLHCTGEGLANKNRPNTASLRIQCPTCGMINDVLFEPTGRLHRVKPSCRQRPMPEPSFN